LSKAATIRNHVLHARPATIADAQRLYRWTAGGPDGAHAFPVTTEYLDDALHRLRALSDTIEAARPPL
jgi:hypothetical protein